MNATSVNPLASTVLFVDDEPLSCKWFARTFEDEFAVLTASGVDEALGILALQGDDLALVVTDYRMPVRDGLDLLRHLQRSHRHLVRLMATAYAEKDVAIAAINEGQVFRVLEKPLDGPQTRLALREALQLYRRQAQERALHENRVQAMRETLGFLAHELNTPLATVRGNMQALRERHSVLQAPAPGVDGRVAFTEHRAGEILAAVEAAERSALYCQSLVSTFVQSARDAYPGAVTETTTAASLVKALLDEFPFERDEREWVHSDTTADFALPGRRDLLYLVLCTLTKNALQALRGTPQPRLNIALGRDTLGDGALKPWLRFADNGSGIPSDVLDRLLKAPVTTRAHAGGNGMGLIFCRRVLQSIGGVIAIESEAGRGTTVTLNFQPFLETNLREARV
ncbi:MAG: hybrid sensor histidine kinase/response regulator [Burkholderiales bacterium]|nr:hybrid sensor histidine kinase/response regulator [Burkholderiales bacterium]